MAVNLIDSTDITITQTGENITLNVEKDNVVSTSSTKPVENQAITNYVDEIKTIVSGTITDGIPYKTGKKYNNKDVYRLVKNLGYLPSGALADRAIAIGITNFTLITAPRIMYFGYLSNIQKYRYFQNPFLGSTNINSFVEENNVLVTTGADRSNFQLVLDIEFIYNN